MLCAAQVRRNQRGDAVRGDRHRGGAAAGRQLEEHAVPRALRPDAGGQAAGQSRDGARQRGRGATQDEGMIIFCIKNKELCIKNTELCIKNKELCLNDDEFCSSGAAARPTSCAV